MKNVFLIVLVALSISVEGQKVIKGLVTDKSQAVPYASVFVKNHTTNGTSTSMDGIFSLTIAPENESDTLVVSFVGFHSAYIPIASLDASAPVNVALDQLIIQLDEQVIKSSKKRKANIAPLIKMILEQMDQDFENIEAIYHTQTNTSFSSNYKTLGYQESIVDIYEKSRKEKDQIRKIQTKVFIDPLTKSKMDAIDTLKNLDPTSSIKGLTVSEGMIRDYLSEKPKNWQLVEQTDKQYVLRYEDKIGFLGLLRYKNICILYVDRVSYSVHRADVHMDVDLNIPFGKKLPAEALPYLNILNISDREIDKFRLRKMFATVKMSSVFTKKGGSIYRGNSYSQADARIQSTKETIIIGAKSEQRILGVQTEGVVPFTEQQTKDRGELITIDVSQLR